MTKKYVFLRWLVTDAYIIALIFLLLSAMQNVGSFPIAVFALTASYGVLILLIWLHERFPPPIK